MAESEYEKLLKKAKGYGIDLSIVMDELDRRIEGKTTSIARNIIDQIPSMKPNIDELATAVAEKVQAGQVNIDEIVSKVVEQIPDTGEVERKRVLKEASEQITGFLSNIDKRLEGMVKPLVESALLEQRGGLLEAVEEKLQRHHDEFMNEAQGGVTESGGEAKPDGSKGSRWGGVPWDTVMPFLEKMIANNQDPLAGIDRLITLREKMAVFDPPSPDAGQQFRASSASFLEGIKLGARSKGIAEPKKSFGPPGGPSKRPVKSSGSLHPAVETL